MMSRQPSRTERRRAQLARRFDSIEAMEARNLITESLGILTAGIGIPMALVGRLVMAEGVAQASTPPRRPASILDEATVPPIAPSPSGSGRVAPVVSRVELPAPPAADAAPSLALAPAANVITVTWAVPPADSSKGGGAGGSSHGGSGSVSPAAPAPFAAPGSSASSAASSPSVVVPASMDASTAATSSSSLAPSSPASPATPATHVVATPAASGATATPSPTNTSLFLIGTGGGSAHPDAMLTFANFPLYTLDYNAGSVLLPNTERLATLGGNVDLRAQVEDTTVSTYSWNTSGLTDATSISGASTYDLTFQWDTSVSAAATNSVTLTVTNTSGQTQVQTYTFLVPAGSGAAGTGTATWPQSLSPDTVSSSAPSFAAHNVSVDANSGSLGTTITLPTYNPNVPAVALSYDSMTANPLPIVTVPHTLDPTQAAPSQVSAQLTFDGTAGSTYYYNTSQFIPGDVQQIALQANAASLATGRYPYSISVGDIRSTTTTTTVTGSTTVINDSASALGAGWTIDGLEKIVPASGGVILDLGSDGKSLWFATGTGSTYVDPAGEFSTLVANAGGTYTRTLTDGATIQFNSSGQEVADVDTNGVAITYGYDGSGRLATIQDHYGNTTTFTYDATTGLLDEITDPAGRVATFTHSGSALSGVTLPDTSTWGYTSNGSGQLSQITDPNGKVVTVAYDSANRVGTIANPDATSETFKAAQEQGFVPSGSGTSGSPAAAILLAQATSTSVNQEGNETDLYPDWQGLGLTDVTSDPLGNVSTSDRDGNGLATITVDPLDRIDQYRYDSRGNVTLAVDPQLYYDQYAYNGFSEVTAHTDPNGNTTTYTYDAYGNNTVIQDAMHNLTTMTYTATGRIATSEDANLHTTSYAYDAQDRLTTVTYPDGATNLYGYDNRGDETSFTDGRGFTTTSSYDAMGRLSGTTDALGDATTYTYDPAGNRTAVDAPLSRTTSYAYDAMNRVTAVTDPLGHATSYSYDADGNRVTVTDPLGRITTTSYDALSRPAAVTDPRGGTTTTAYDADSERTSVTDPLGRVTSWTYTPLGDVATVTDPLGNVTTMGYDPAGDMTSELQPLIVGNTPTAYTYDADERVVAVADHLGRTTTTVYDAVGNTIATVDGAGDRTTYVYDSRDRVIAEIDPLGHATSYGYDADGDQTTVTDPLGDVTTTSYDALDRVASVSQPIGGSTTYAYDAAGRQAGLTDPDGNRTTWTYDVADRVTAEANPLGTTTYAYDAAGQQTATTDADGRQTTYAYDGDGNQTGETWVGASPAETIVSTYDADNELTRVSDSFATLTYTYDADGRQLTAATSSPGGQPAVTLTSSYDSLGDRASVADNLSSPGTISFGYDSMRQMTSIAASFGTAGALHVAFSYDQAGRMTSIARSTGSGAQQTQGTRVGTNGLVGGGGGATITTSMAYDAASRVTTITHQISGGATIDSYAYGYDAADRLTSETNHKGTSTYGYDASDELTGVSGPAAASYTYDSNGNRTMTGYAAGSDNTTTAGAGYTYTYDAEGNLTSKTQASTGDVWTYTWDYRNRLTGVVEKTSGGSVLMQGTYTYDAMDRRIVVDETVSGTESKTSTVYDGVNPYADFNGSGTLLVRYLYGSGTNQILARTSASGTTAWYLADHEGSIRDIVNTSGTVIDHVAYDAYGNVTSESSPSNGDRFKYDAMAWDAAIGLYYDNARWYDPSIGRFITQDPEGFIAGDDDLYRYTQNHPSYSTDPSGLDWRDRWRDRWDRRIDRWQNRPRLLPRPTIRPWGGIWSGEDPVREHFLGVPPYYPPPIYNPFEVFDPTLYYGGGVQFIYTFPLR